MDTAAGGLVTARRASSDRARAADALELERLRPVPPVPPRLPDKQRDVSKVSTSGAWIRLATSTPRHPRVRSLSVDARWLYVVGICYAGEHATDGVLPGDLTDTDVDDKARDELIDAGLWIPRRRGGGYEIRDYLDYNPSHATIDKRTENARKAARTRWEREPRKGRSDA